MYIYWMWDGISNKNNAVTYRLLLGDLSLSPYACDPLIVANRVFYIENYHPFAK